MLTIADLHSYYALAHVLRGVSVEAVDGRVLALLGRNGAGKTTLVSSIMGIPPAQVRQGSIRYAGQELIGCPTHQIARMRTGSAARIEWMPSMGNTRPDPTTAPCFRKRRRER